MNPATFFMLVFPLIAIGLAFREKHMIAKQVSTIPYRINVNGTRGKSTVTRLLTAALLEAGIPTVGKTTGSKSCILSFEMEDGKYLARETELIRRPEGPNIKEVKLVIREALQKDARAIVAECMAVAPDYQKVFAKEYLRSNFSIVTNVREDHMDVQGPSLQDAADAFMAAVPESTTLIVLQDDFTAYFSEAAEGRNIVLRVADASLVSEEYCGKFSFPVFEENVALALEAALALGIGEDVAMAGMLKAIPDSGAICFQKIKGKAGEGVLINAFSANDPTTTIAIWDYLESREQVNRDTTLIMNCRNDRMDRARYFLKGVLEKIPAKSLILIGEGTGLIYTNRKTLSFSEVTNLEGFSAKNIAQYLQERCKSKDVFLGIGNYFGVEEICRELGGE
ncbi:MAG: poly-gamma-glutamate synthase PgsB [Firmicutes bacterium]|nr:poly-gamma-glutamate synthase PgsB [Bacillota bacterium]